VVTQTHAEVVTNVPHHRLRIAHALVVGREAAPDLTPSDPHRGYLKGID
jgi:hypothetical protein